jgi:hypothetical protein
MLGQVPEKRRAVASGSKRLLGGKIMLPERHNVAEFGRAGPIGSLRHARAHAKRWSATWGEFLHDRPTQSGVSCRDNSGTFQRIRVRPQSWRTHRHFAVRLFARTRRSGQSPSSEGTGPGSSTTAAPRRLIKQVELDTPAPSLSPNPRERRRRPPETQATKVTAGTAPLPETGDRTPRRTFAAAVLLISNYAPLQPRSFRRAWADRAEILFPEHDHASAAGDGPVKIGDAIAA